MARLHQARTVFVSAAFGFLALAPAIAFAQIAQDDLRDAVQASVMADPRVASVPPTELKGLIDALVQQAQAQNIQASDILWQPQRAAAASAVSAGQMPCPGGFAGYACQFNRAFGFEGNNYEVPIFLLIVSGLLLLVIWELIAHHRKVIAEKAAKSSLGTLA